MLGQPIKLKINDAWCQESTVVNEEDWLGILAKLVRERHHAMCRGAGLAGPVVMTATEVVVGEEAGCLLKCWYFFCIPFFHVKV